MELPHFAVTVFRSLLFHLLRVYDNVAQHHAVVIRIDAALIDALFKGGRLFKIQSVERENIRRPVDPPKFQVQSVHFLRVCENERDLGVLRELFLLQHFLTYLERDLFRIKIKFFFCLDICVQNDHGFRNPHMP